MSLANDLENLEQLRNRGALSETEYSQAKARLLQQPETPRPNASSLNGLRRSNVDRWLGGVCGGSPASQVWTPGCGAWRLRYW